MESALYLRQLKAGRDFATTDPVAGGMQNFVYLIGDEAAHECVVVDPAWDVPGILDCAKRDDMRVVGALVTHYHPDHVGGPLFGHAVQGLAKLLALNPCRIYAHSAEVEGVYRVSGISKSDVTAVSGNEKIAVGAVEIECLHTPGHTPGSQCFRCAGALVSGDTLFLQGCGRVDLPGGDSDEMYRTLSQRLSTLPGDLVLYPGHDYGDRPHDTLSSVRRTNSYLRVPDLATWKRYMG